MRTRSNLRANLVPCGGLLVPPLLWAVNTQLGQILPYVECTAHFALMGVLSFAGAVLSLAAGFWSWQAVPRNGLPASGTGFPNSVGFLGALSGLNGLVFAFTLALQGASSLMLTGCER
ncbi:MAG: hypothetical protein JWO51_804 [Rhodospirillales bacterium]|nr:hypothetical protein [Rhodospirillales bacterium]